MIDIKKPVTMLEYLKGEKKLNTKRIDFLKGNQDNIWKASDQKATKEELTSAKTELETAIADKADASDITTINETLAGKASQDDLDSLSGVVDGKAEQSQVDSLASDVADKASQADLTDLANEVGTKASQSALNSLSNTVNNKADQADLDTATGRIGTLESESATKEEVAFVEEKRESIGTNLITNGNLLLGNNYNFPGLTYDGSDSPTGFNGSLRTSEGGQYVTSERITVDLSKKIALTLWAKHISDPNLPREDLFYPRLDFFDVDGLSIRPKHCGFVEGTTTTLINDLVAGDTTFEVADSTNWDASNPTYTFRQMIVWNWSNTYGYKYPEEVYSRTAPIIFTAINGNIITLSSVYSGPTILAGTSVSQHAFNGNGWSLGYVKPTTEWVFYEKILDKGARKLSTAAPGIYNNMIPLACAYIKLNLYMNYRKLPGRDNVGWDSTQYISGIRMFEYSDNSNILDGSLSQSKITNLTTDLASKASSSALSTAVADLSTDIAEKASNDDLDDTNANVTALQTSKADKTALSNLEGVVNTKANQTALNTLSDEVDNKASLSALARTTHMDIYSNANLQSFIIGPAYSTATAFCTELGLFLEIKTPVWLSQTKLYMKEADNVLVQLYNYENDVVIYEESFALVANENIISLGVLLPAGRYYFSGTGDVESLAYFPTTDYSITHHFVSVFGGELDPVAFPAFTPGTTSQWAGFYQMTFQVPFKALYLGLLPAKEPNANLIKGAFYHVNDSNFLRTWCFDGTSQISN